MGVEGIHLGGVLLCGVGLGFAFAIFSCIFLFHDLQTLDSVLGLVDAAAKGQVVKCSGELQGVPLVVQRENGLHGALAERSLSDNQGPVPVLEGAGHDFSCTGRPLVHKYYHGHVGVHDTVFAGVAFGLLGAALGAHNHVAPFQEQFANLDGLVQESTRIVAHVQNQLFHALLLQVLQGVFHIAQGLVAEGGKLDIADVVSDHPVIGHGMNHDFGTGNGKVHQLGYALALDRDGHVCADLSAEFAYGVVQGQALGVLAVDFTDAVAGPDAQSESRGPGKGRNHGEDIVTETDGDAHAAELSFHGNLQALVVLGGEHCRVWVQNVTDAVQGRVGKFRGVYIFHVLAVHFGEYLVESGDLVVKVSRRGGFFGCRGYAQGGQGKDKCFAQNRASDSHAQKIQFIGGKYGEKRKKPALKAGF